MNKMSDNARIKKNPPHKETAPKRPVILKYDRETISKEIDRDVTKVVEKEIQPTILIKAREPSTSKDNDNRPASPKRSTRDNEIETQVIHPSKIAHNEDKPRERKVPETKLLQAATPVMTNSVKLLTESLEFNSAAMDYLQDNNTNFLVVGVLGLQGVGKSSILNLLASENMNDDICSKILNSHDTCQRDSSNQLIEDMKYLNVSGNPLNSADDKSNTSQSYFKFKTQDANQIERGLHCTTGVDMYVTRSRVILLDACAAGSASLLDSCQERISHTDALQAAALLLAVSHVVILVQDWFVDYNIVRFIQAAEMLKPSLPSLGASVCSAGGTEADGEPEEPRPHLLLLHNRCMLDDFRPQSVQVMQEFYAKVFERSNLHLHSGMYLYSPDSTKSGLNQEAVCHNLNAQACGKPINLFLMPEMYDDQENTDIYRGHPPAGACATRLRWQVLSARRPHSLHTAALASLSERAWALHCARAWDAIRKSSFFMEYGRLLP